MEVKRKPDEEPVRTSGATEDVRSLFEATLKSEATKNMEKSSI